MLYMTMLRKDKTLFIKMFKKLLVPFWLKKNDQIKQILNQMFQFFIWKCEINCVHENEICQFN